MTDAHDVFRTLHRVLKQREDLESRLRRGPKQLVIRQTRVAVCEKELAEAKLNVQTARMSADAKQLQLKSREMRVEDLKAKLNTANSNKEYQAFKEQIAADEQANAVLADETFEMLEKVDELQEVVRGIEQRLQETEAEVAEVSGQVEEEQENLKAELARILGELDAVERQIPAEVKADYVRMVKTRGESSLAVVENGTCGNCCQTLSPQMLNNVNMKRTVVCGGCGSILYLPEIG